MLTRDLLRFRSRKGKIYPQFLDPDDASLQRAAEALVEVFRQASAAGSTRQELTEETSLQLQSQQLDNPIGRGLEKLLLDRSEFDTGDPAEQQRFRESIFIQARQALREEAKALNPNLKEFWKRVEILQSQPVAQIQEALYADLPVQQRLLQFSPIGAEALLHRYNCGQVQGLLLNSEALELRLEHPDPGPLRQLCKYLRFHQLLAQITTDEQGIFQLRIDGPLSLFYKTQKYGLQLANFFPAILQQKNWQLRATVCFRQKPPLQLQLDPSCGIRSHYQQFHDYVPPEFQQISDRLKERQPEWQLELAGSFVPLPGDRYCFPDFVLQHQTGASVALELFHGWHAGPLRQRLQQLEEVQGVPLLLGVSNSLSKNPELGVALETSSYFQTFGFSFRELPTVDKFTKVLQSWWGATQR